MRLNEVESTLVLVSFNGYLTPNSLHLEDSGAKRWGYNVLNHLSPFIKEQLKKSSSCSLHFNSSLYQNYPVCFNLAVNCEEYRHPLSQLQVEKPRTTQLIAKKGIIKLCKEKS